MPATVEGNALSNLNATTDPMKTPSLDDMKLAVARMLPDVLTDPGLGSGPGNLEIYWEEDSVLDAEPVKDREWLHVCWLAEETLTVHQGESYCEILKDVCGCDVDAGKASRVCYFASAEQRLEALCRVKYPEMFTASTI